MAQKAILVADDLRGPAAQVAKILEFFEVPWEQVDAPSMGNVGSEAAAQGYCVLAPMPLIGRALMARTFGASLPPLLQRAESIFLFGGDQSSATEALLRFVSHCATAKLVQVQGKEILCSVSAQSTTMRGPLSGLEVLVPVRDTQLAIRSTSSVAHIDSLISTSEGSVFSAVDVQGSPCYLAPCPTVIDLARPVEKGYFDVADYFFSAVPLVMYLRHAFASVMLAPGEHGACLIVDDPVLRPQYGFVDFRRIAELGAEHNFTCNFAFIPWNWKRSRSSVVKLFKLHAERLSLSIHGCDHTASEFSAESNYSVNRQAKLANSRMTKHQRRTGLVHEPLMIFPQGAFSATSPMVLKHNGFIAAVNTEVSPKDQPFQTEIGETWRMAILKYGDFAIYTRRYMFHGLFNFAFDVLLGKPCLIVTHHADFRNDGREVVDFIGRLNSLQFPLTWRSLGEVIRRAYQQRLLKDGTQQIRMFGNEINVRNDGLVSRHIVVEKVEHDPGGVDRVALGGHQVPFVSDRALLRFEFDLGGRDSKLASVVFKDIYGDVQHKRHLKRKIKVAARRYLCECRDEAQARAPWLYEYARKARGRKTEVSEVT
jgi:hypothetical protein